MRPRSGANARCCRTIALFLNVSMHVSRSFLGSVWRPMAMKCLLAILAVGLLVIGGLATGGAALSPSARGFVAGTGAAIPFRTPAAGGGEGPLDATGPFVAYTLVLSNNTLIPGNFLAKNPVATPDFIAYDSGKGEMFVTDERSNNVTVISDSTNAVIANIPVGSYPIGLACDSGKGEVFVTNSGSNNVTVISDSTNAVIANIPVGSYPSGAAYDSGKGEMFVTNYGVISNNVTVISDATHAVIANIPVGSYPIGVAYDPGNGYIYVANYFQGTISIISSGGQAPPPPIYAVFLGATAFAIAIAVAAVVLAIRRKRRAGR